MENIIESVMHSRHMSYGELSERTGLAKGTLHYYAKRENAWDVPAEKMEKIANALGVSFNYLYGLPEEEEIRKEDPGLHCIRVFTTSDDPHNEELIDTVLALPAEKKQEALRYLQFLLQNG